MNRKHLHKGRTSMLRPKALVLICFMTYNYSGKLQGQSGGFIHLRHSSKLVLNLQRAATELYKYDEFGDIDCNDELSRLDGFSNLIQDGSTRHAYIIVYGGRSGRRGEALARGNRIRMYLIRRRGIDSARIVVISGGFRERLTIELWRGIRGGCPPVVTPTVSPNAVRFRRGSVEELRYNCG